MQIVNQTLNELKVEKHPDKTFIGRIAKGFDFLGYSFEPKWLIAPKTLANFLERAIRLYEHGVQMLDASGNTSGISGDGRTLGLAFVSALTPSSPILLIPTG